MENKKQTSYNFNSIDLLIYIWSKRWILVIVGVVAGIASIIASLLITPMFRSTVIMFPVSNVFVAKQLMEATDNDKLNLHDFGEEEQSEQLLQILHSEQIRSRIIEKYNLMEHYEIDSGVKFPETELLKLYRSNINFSMTEYMAVEISVMDSDPEIAAAIANDISDLVDTVYNNLKRERTGRAMQLVEREYDRTVEKLNAVQDSMGILSEQLTRKISGPGDPSDNLIKAFAADGAGLLAQHFQVKTEISMVSAMRIRFMEARIEAQQDLPYKYVVDKAFPAEKKAYPKKSLIVVVATFSALLFALIVLIVIDNIKERVTARNKE